MSRAQCYLIAGVASLTVWACGGGRPSPPAGAFSQSEIPEIVVVRLLPQPIGALFFRKPVLGDSLLHSQEKQLLLETGIKGTIAELGSDGVNLSRKNRLVLILEGE